MFVSIYKSIMNPVERIKAYENGGQETVSRRGKTLSIIGVICIVVTIALFLLMTNEKNTMDQAGFCSIILAEIVLFGGLLFLEYISAKLPQIILSAVGGGALIAIPLISILVSLLFMISQSHAYRAFAAIQIVSLAIIAILLIIVGKQAKTEVKNRINLGD